jgi:hypothetical protein
MRRVISRIKKTERGTVMLLTAVVLVAMLGMLALSIDLGFLYSSRSQLQNGLDAAALAGAVNLRATIEASIKPAPERDKLVIAAATEFAFANKVRRYKEKDPQEDPDDPINKIKLGEGDVFVRNLDDPPLGVAVSVVPDTQLVYVQHTVEVPMFFSGLFGLNTANIGGTALASVAPVDGGTGGIGGGLGSSACWRPLFLPDTFFDANNKVWTVGERANGDNFELPMQPGDYYRSRFALGARNTLPFVHVNTSDGGWVTGIRDTQYINEVGAKTHLGTLLLRIPQKYYLIPDLSGAERTTRENLPLEFQAQIGFCGRLYVGMEIPIFERLPGSKPYADVQKGLGNLKLNYSEEPRADAWAQYRYVSTTNFPGANTHPAILPVLLFDPLILKKNPDGTDPPLPSGFKIKVTNIGLFYLARIDPNGDLIGTFVREVFAEGRPIAKENMPLGTADSPPSFQRSWLPVAPRLIK